MTKAQETIARRRAILAILGEGWKAGKGVEGCRDLYKKSGVCVMPQRTTSGNFYVGSTSRGFCYTQTIEQAAVVANGWVK